MKQRKAKVNHQCHKCREDIPKGDQYLIGMKGNRYHISCGSTRSIKQKVELYCRILKRSSLQILRN